MANTPRHAALSRRELLRYGGILGGSAALAPMLGACTGSGGADNTNTPAPTRSFPSEPIAIEWWDEDAPLVDFLEKTLIPAYQQKRTNVTVKHTMTAELDKALQTARRTDQLPDILDIPLAMRTVAGSGSSTASVVEDGWVQPISDYVDFEGLYVNDFIYDGFHRFDGKVYSFPLYDQRWHETNPRLNTKLFDQANVAFDEPATWDDLRSVLRDVSKATDKPGVLFPMKNPGYVRLQLENLAQLAGAPGPGIDMTTGEYVWDSQPFLDAMEFLVALQKDGLIHQASAGLDTQQALPRMAAGEAVCYFIGPAVGPWLAATGAASMEEAGFDVWRMPGPGSDRGLIHKGPPMGQYWVSSASPNPDVCADLLIELTSDETYRTLAKSMIQAPIKTEIVQEIDVDPVFAKSIETNVEDVRILPIPEGNNPDVAKVLTEIQAIAPDPGAIVAAVLTGANDDYAGALKKYNDDVATERERALKVAQGEGADVSIEDWAFPDWNPNDNYQA